MRKRDPELEQLVERLRRRKLERLREKQRRHRKKQERLADPLAKRLLTSTDGIEQTGVTRYFIRDRDGDYFAGWIGTEWETVKRTATWTKDKSKAPSFLLDELDKNGHMEIVCGFAGTTLEKTSDSAENQLQHSRNFKTLDAEAARSDYDAAWECYVKAPGGREKARRKLTKAREALDKAMRQIHFTPPDRQPEKWITR